MKQPVVDDQLVSLYRGRTVLIAPPVEIVPKKRIYSNSFRRYAVIINSIKWTLLDVQRGIRKSNGGQSNLNRIKVIKDLMTQLLLTLVSLALLGYKKLRCPCNLQLSMLAVGYGVTMVT